MTDDLRPPRGLDTAGRRFWRDTMVDFEPSHAERALLEAACRLIDECARLEAVVRNSPVMVPGSKGQERVHPAISELRHHRVALARLLSQLGLDGVEGASDATTRSSEGRRLALVRWHGKRDAS